MSGKIINMPERMDDFSKILLATQSINYIANNLNAIILDYKIMLSSDTGISDIVKEGLKNKQDQLRLTLTKVHEAAEDIADFMNNCDACCPIDEIVLNPAFNILNGDDLLEQ